MTDIAPEDRARADLYGFLATLLSAPPDQALLTRCAALGGDDETPVGRAVAQIAEAASATPPDQAAALYARLFIGLGRGEILPFASYYITGNLNDRPLADLRGDMARLGIDRAAGMKDPEDHIASVCEMMAGLILGAFGAPASIEAQADFFDAHLAPWAGRLFAELAGAEDAGLYAGVGQLGAVFMEIETQAFEMARA